MRRPLLTIAIITKNRNTELARLLASFVTQTMQPENLVIIDNSWNAVAKSVVEAFSKYFSIKYIHEKKQGIPFARNTALSVVESPYLAFVDDDCVVDKNWVKIAKNVIATNKKYTYFVGKNSVFNAKNSLAYAQYIHQNEWFFQKLNKDGTTSQFNVDTKNIIFRVADLRRKNIAFDTQMLSCEDTDLGFTLKDSGAQGFFIKNLRVWHDESSNLPYVLKKIYIRGSMTHKIVKKWKYKKPWVEEEAVTFFGYLRSIGHWGTDYQRFKNFDNQLDFLQFTYIKLFELAFLRGYRSSL